jgi:proteasome lid subunit RPN8/RPN11
VTDTKSKLLERLSDALAPGLPERCGLVGARGGFHEVGNIHVDPVAGFHMEPSALIDAVEKGAVATWHTHPGKDPNLSDEDMAGFKQWPQLRHYIVGIRDGEPCVVCFMIEDGIVMKVTG